MPTSSDNLGDQESNETLGSNVSHMLPQSIAKGAKGVPCNSLEAQVWFLPDLIQSLSPFTDFTSYTFAEIIMTMNMTVC